MQFLSIVSTVINDGEAFISGNEPETFVGAAETAGSVASDFLDKFMNMDFIKEIFTSYAGNVFAIGFAFATVLILITFGVFKAFSLVRID
ncbi:MAG: hypothetical protein ACLU9T_14740 [Blautia faecis]